MSTAPAVDAIAQIAINAHDIARARDFYRDKLGLKFLFDAGTMAFFDCGGVRLMVSLPSSAELDHPSSIIYFKVSDIKATHAQLTARGIKFGTEPHMIARLPGREVWLAEFRDTEGNVLALMSEVPV
jgi:predicted enzyme related to lactoylglutathione lyase